jgi:RNA polymerase sigma-32 factor
MTRVSNALVSAPEAAGAMLAIPPVGNIDAYISAVHRVPMLTAESEVSLARRLQNDGDLDAARQLVLSHLRLVVSIARQYMGYGLMKAVKRFDPDRGVRLVSFAMHWIKAEIHEYILKNWRLVKVATTKAQRKLFFNLRSMKRDTHTLSPEAAQAIARDLNVRVQDVIEMETRMGGGDIALEPTDDGGDDDYAPIAYLRATHSEPTQVLEDRAFDRLQGEGLLEALESLDARSRRIIEARWLRDDDDGGTLTLHELADEFGVSAERIRQIEAKALKTMKNALAEYA